MTLPPLLIARHVRKHFTVQRPFLGEQFTVIAVDDVSLSVGRGATLAVVGESGSGKSTLARCLARLEEPTSGEIWFDECNIAGLTDRQLVPFRSRIQMVFQDAATALNPRFTAREIIEEPLLIQRWGTREQRRQRALELMDQVQLSSTWAKRRPFELSGGQRQRLAIARALALRPELLILDEGLSGVDASIQAQIVNLLLELQASLNLTYIFISHDLTLIPHLADEIAVMSRGRIVETGRTSNLCSNPARPETLALFESVPTFQAHR